ncbi:MAG: response regulator [Phenylobacterium sp.]|nr:MAG: response regulator [Phenylobacterium sp.]
MPRSTSQMAEPHMAHTTVFLVDNDLAAWASTRDALSGAGYAVDEFLCGRRALERILAEPPDVLITEILMPDCDGIELISAVTRAHPAVRIIAVAARRFLGGLDLLDLASKLGAHAALDKPLEAEGLLATVQRVIPTEAPRGKVIRQVIPRNACAPDPPPRENCSPRDPRWRRARQPDPGRRPR